jgi:hypothetical protein
LAPCGVKASISHLASSTLTPCTSPLRPDEAAAGAGLLSAAVNRHFEASRGDVARLQVRMGVEAADLTRLESHLHQYQFRQDGHDAAANARLCIRPITGFGRYHIWCIRHRMSSLLRPELSAIRLQSRSRARQGKWDGC